MFPRIVSRKRSAVSRWMDLIEKTVQFTPGGDLESYYCVTQAPYVAVFAKTVDGLIPIVRQYRPAVEQFTWELPAGTVDGPETPEDAARRELQEETALEPEDMIYLGNFLPDTGRLQIESHAFYATVGRPQRESMIEQGLTMRLASHAELRSMIISGEFRHQLHLAVYAAVLARGIDLD